MKIVIQTANQSMFFFCVIIISKYFLMGVTKIKKLKKTTGKNVIIRKTRVGKTQKGGAMKALGAGRTKGKSQGKAKEGYTIEGTTKLTLDEKKTKQDAKAARQEAFTTGVIEPLKKALEEPNITPERRNKILLQIAESQTKFGQSEAQLLQNNKATRRTEQGVAPLEQPRKKRTKGDKAKVLKGRLEKATETAGEKKATADRAKAELATLESKVSELAGTVELAKNGAPPEIVAESVTKILTGLNKEAGVIEEVKQLYGSITAINLHQGELIGKYQVQGQKIAGYTQKLESLDQTMQQEFKTLSETIAEKQQLLQAPEPKGLVGRFLSIFKRNKTDLRSEISRLQTAIKRLPVKRKRSEMDLRTKIEQSQKEQSALEKSISEQGGEKERLSATTATVVKMLAQNSVANAQKTVAEQQLKANVATVRVEELARMANQITADTAKAKANANAKLSRTMQEFTIKQLTGAIALQQAAASGQAPAPANKPATAKNTAPASAKKPATANLENLKNSTEA